MNHHKTLIARLPDTTLVQLDFPNNSLEPRVRSINECCVGNEEIREARTYIWKIEFTAFGQRYEVTIPQNVRRLHEYLGKLPDGRYVVLYDPLDTSDVLFEQLVSLDDHLCKAAKVADRILLVRKVS